MADGLTTQSTTLATIPSSTLIATDDAGAAGHVQLVKLAVSTDGSATALTADNSDGLLVNLGTNNDVTDGGGSLTVDAPVGTPVFVRLSDGSSAISALPVTDNSGSLTVDGAVTARLGQSRIAVTPTISASSIYASGDAVGGKLTFANAARTSGGSITITAVLIVDKDQELAPLELVLFNDDFTAVSDNAVFDPTDADLASKFIGVVKVSDYANFNDNSVATRECRLPATLVGTSLYGQLVVRGTPTYTATDDIIVAVQIAQD